MGHILINLLARSRRRHPPTRRRDSQNDKDARAFRDRGCAHALLQEFEKAEADLKKAAEVDPSDYENFAVMANIYLFQENLPAGIDALTKAIAAYKPKRPPSPRSILAGYIARADAWRSSPKRKPIRRRPRRR